jgi:hypothetical protein
MIENSNGLHTRPSFDETFAPTAPPVLTLEMPDVEEIAKAIWERQHNKLPSHALSYQTRWRDESIPHKFWEEFLLDAQAVLRVLYRKHVEYESK